MQYKHCFGPKSLKFNLKDDIFCYEEFTDIPKRDETKAFLTLLSNIKGTLVLATYLAIAMCHAS